MTVLALTETGPAVDCALPSEQAQALTRTCASLLADLDVHPRVAMQILRHADFDITMEIYTQVSSKKTRDALNTATRRRIFRVV